MVAGPSDHPNVPASVPAAPDVSVSFDRLEEREHIGSGGTADVAKVVDGDSGEPLAVKQPRLDGTLQADAVESFLEEAETWSRLDDHDHVVGVVDWGGQPVPWIALEYMDGGTLRDRIGDLSTAEAVWIGWCGADGIHHAHRRGVAHLDLTPDNVLFRVTDRGLWDAPKLSDWGLAKQLLYHSRDVEGLSPRYAAPEQFDDAFGSPDDITDVYQLGTLVYEMLTGDPPFTGPVGSVVESHLSETPDPPTAVDPSLPPAADDVLATALATERAERYESMLDFRRDLASLFESVTDGATGRATSAGRTGAGGATGTRASDRTERPGRSSDRRDSDRSGDAGGREVDFGAGSTLDDDGSGVLDSIRDRSEADHEREIPWETRDDVPGAAAEGGDGAERGATDPARDDADPVEVGMRVDPDDGDEVDLDLDDDSDGGDGDGAWLFGLVVGALVVLLGAVNPLFFVLGVLIVGVSVASAVDGE